MRVLHVVGNRPQFIKLAPVSREFRKRGIEEIIVHTGQHYDDSMSDIFFRELEIPLPDMNLSVGSGTHAEVTGRALERLEKVMLRYCPEVVVVYGDTNSTLAASLAAVKLQRETIHVEAGPRSFDRWNPEENNRIVVDHLASICCATDLTSVWNLQREGIAKERIVFTGDVMYDEFLSCQEKSPAQRGDFILLTWHRQENTESRRRMEQILSLLERLPYPIVFPLHPRTKNKLNQFGLMERLCNISGLRLIEPVGYMEMVGLLKGCRFVVTDSGGLSKEASFAGKKCFYFLNLEIWPELIKSGWIRLFDLAESEDIDSCLQEMGFIYENGIQAEPVSVFGDGRAAEKIVDAAIRLA